MINVQQIFEQELVNVLPIDEAGKADAATVSISRNSTLADAVKALSAANERIHKINPIVMIGNTKYVLATVDHMSLFEHTNGIISLAWVYLADESSRNRVAISYDIYRNKLILPQ